MPQLTSLPNSLKKIIVTAKTIKEQKIPNIVLSESLIILNWFSLLKLMKEYIFNESMGSTHGIKFNINPPIKARNKIEANLISLLTFKSIIFSSEKFLPEIKTNRLSGDLNSFESISNSNTICRLLIDFFF